MGGIVAIGECMVELALGEAGTARIAYAGDTFNTAVYLSRLGREVAYATALGGDDPFTAGILGLMADEGISDALVAREAGGVPGLYAIDKDEAGERRFFYWRGEAPVRRFFDLADADALRQALAAAELVFVSGITLAVLGAAGRDRLLALLAEAGATVAFDPNYRARLWDGPETARAAAEQAARISRYVSLSAPDAEAITGQPAAAVARAWAEAGAEVVRREDDRSAFVHLPGGGVVEVGPGPTVEDVVDTTGAGDSFNAAYLAARLAGRDPAEAVAAGRRLAEAVIRRRGAIIPKDAMP